MFLVPGIRTYTKICCTLLFVCCCCCCCSVVAVVYFFVSARDVVRVVSTILRDMALCRACGMRLAGANIAAIEAEIAAGPSYAYTDSRLLKLGRSRK